MDPAITIEKLKSILKKSQLLDDKEDIVAKKERDAYAREVATQYAKTIQLRKDIEAQVLDSLVVLSEYPTHRGAPYSVKNPARDDVSDFKVRIRLFQPSDYDDLIEERNHNGLCGYTLCGKPHIKIAGTGVWKIVNTGRKDFNIVPKVDIEKWCSTHCARRAMYIRVQLNETAVWERAGSDLLTIDLLKEENQDLQELNSVVSEMDKLKIEKDHKNAENLKTLANERGENGRFGDAITRVRVGIKPKTAKKEADVTLEIEDNGDAHLKIDGYKTTIGTIQTA